jgi:hypothetical protein
MKRLFLAAAVMTALLVPASSALAAPHHPTGEFAQFGDCPLSKASLKGCLYAETSSGFFQIGAKNTPVKTPVILQAGLEWPEGGDGILDSNLAVVGAEDGNTLTKVPQPVPGGLLGVTAPSWWPQILKDLFNETINNGFTGVTATLELAVPASSIKLSVLNLVLGQGTAMKLPVKVKLDNPFLGSSCYIGSNSNPITLNLTTGTTSPPAPNKPITGNTGEGSSNEAGSLITIKNNKLVDNSFAAPGANGCGGFLFSWAVDPLVNSIVGVPSPAGTNSAVLEGTLKTALAPAVRSSE